MAERSWFWVALIAFYYTLHTVIRTLSGGSLGLDEAQIFRHAQYLSWGYGPQPPLYAWMQFGVFRLVGETILALSAFKNLLLFLMVTSWFLLFRKEWSVFNAGLAACALILVPQFSWESQRALTHSVLAGTMTALLYAAVWPLLKGDARSYWRYSLIGVILAAGILSKPTFVVVPLAILLATLSMPELRRKLSKKGLLLSLFIGVLLCTPYFIWSLGNPDLVLGSAHKFEVEKADPVLIVALQGTLGLATAVLMFLLLPLIVMLGVGLSSHEQRRPYAGRLFTHWLIRCICFGISLALIIVLLSQTTNVKDRWLQALLMPAAPVMAYLLLHRISFRGVKRLASAMIFCAALVTIALPIRMNASAVVRTVQYDKYMPLIRENMAADTKIITGDWPGGNILYRDPSLPLVRPNTLLDQEGDYIVVWSERRWPSWLKEIDPVFPLGPGTWRPGDITEISFPYRNVNSKEFKIYLTSLHLVEN